uniref:Uncharacterized protein n=1 Tax=Oryza barthii TaxID=65489 RepID=A0A0D3H456_9ORYZ
MPGGPSRVADADDDDELSHLLSLAEANLNARHLRAAHKHAPRTAHLNPDSPRGSLLLTAISVLVADHSFHRATLLQPDSDSQGSHLSPSALRRYYKSLRSGPLSSSPVIFSTIKEALRCVADAYAAPALVSLPHRPACSARHHAAGFAPCLTVAPLRPPPPRRLRAPSSHSAWLLPRSCPIPHAFSAHLYSSPCSRSSSSISPCSQPPPFPYAVSPPPLHRRPAIRPPCPGDLLPTASRPET